MGGKQTKIYTNATISSIASNSNSKKLQPPLKHVKAYTSHIIPQQFETQIYSLLMKKTISSESLQSYVYPKPESLILLTYNVWFQDGNYQNRYPCILNMLKNSKADIICLQEVNSNFLNLIHASLKELVQNGEYFMPVMPMHWYDTLIISKYPCRFYKKVFTNSFMSRCNLTAVIQFYDSKNQQLFKLGINCVHLQSMNNQTLRIQQIQQIKKMNKDLDMSIIAGDFNFSDGWKQNIAISEYTDVWKQGKRYYSKWADQQMKQLGYTMPCSERFPPWRPDHVIFKRKINEKEKDQRCQIQIIGDFTIQPFEKDTFHKVTKDGYVRTPSDHFGLITKIQL